jgi:hypothetical protein
MVGDCYGIRNSIFSNGRVIAAAPSPVAVRLPDDLGVSGHAEVPIVDQRSESERRLPFHSRGRGSSRWDRQGGHPRGPKTDPVASHLFAWATKRSRHSRSSATLGSLLPLRPSFLGRHRPHALLCLVRCPEAEQRRWRRTYLSRLRSELHRKPRASRNPRPRGAKARTTSARLGAGFSAYPEPSCVHSRRRHN